MPDRRFVWLIHTPAMARWLKRELTERAPTLRFAFARPGLSTFKHEPGELPEDWLLPSSFARAWGFSLGRAQSTRDVLALANTLASEPLRLHVFERPRDEQDMNPGGERARALRSALLTGASDRFHADPHAQPGELVLDVITPPTGEADEPWLVGHHRSERHARDPGGVEPHPPPPEAPSRAWSKLEEALRWGDLSVQPGERALEIGAAPGGASFALLERGVSVIGIDPGPVAPNVLAHPSGFTHVRRPYAELTARERPRKFDLLLLDVNLAPMITLRYIEDLLRDANPRLALLTLKINDDAVARSLPRLHARLVALAGPRGRVRVTQLPSHRSEVVAIVEWPRDRV
jgi:23S rRNA (cytidine2498-2'-O)-methyltransferase